MQNNKDDFSLSGFLSTPKVAAEDWSDTYMGDFTREGVKDSFRHLFLPNNSPGLDPFLTKENSVFGSPTEPQLVPEWFPFQDSSSETNVNWVNLNGSRVQSNDTTCSVSSSTYSNHQGVKQRDVKSEKDSYVSSWSFQRPTFPQYPLSKANSGGRADPEKDFLMREFKKKIREAAVVRFRQKRKERNFANVVRYDCRKRVADARPRYKGRFVKVQKEENCASLYKKSVSARLSTLEKRNDEDCQVVPYLVE
jgi:hypothetical protein